MTYFILKVFHDGILIQLLTFGQDGTMDNVQNVDNLNYFVIYLLLTSTNLLVVKSLNHLFINQTMVINKVIRTITR
jgi:hypothetical protein